LRPFPSCSIARLDSAPARAAGGLYTLPRGSELVSAAIQGVPCRFRTAYDIHVAPVTVSSACFQPLARVPSGLVMPGGANGLLSLAIDGGGGQADLSQPDLPKLRLFIDGELSLCAALRDTLFMRTTAAYAEVDDGRWIPLPAVPVVPAGFSEEDALIPFGARSHPAYRVLAEYFAFPEKFNFIDVDLDAIARHLPRQCRRVTLHLAITGVRHDSGTASLLRNFSAHNLLANCSPVVNLFTRHAEPIALTQTTTDYPVRAHPTQAHAFEVYSIDSVHMLSQRAGTETLFEFRRFHSLRHGENGASQGRYWSARRDESLAQLSPGHETRLTLIDTTSAALEGQRSSLSIELHCTNRDLPYRLKYGQVEGDLSLPAGGTGESIRLLRQPSLPHRFESRHGLHWRLISHLALNQHALTQEGLPALREMLALYDLPQSPISQRQIGGIVGLDSSDTTHWLRHRRGATLVHGVEIRVTLDEEAYVGSGMHLFVQVLDHFLGLYAQVNSFVELVALSQRSGKELIRCQPRSGSSRLV
ncbi:MAG: type VI secretion system baseplate subunit TssF, partial [Sphingomonadaceae bacterium]